MKNLLKSAIVFVLAIGIMSCSQTKQTPEYVTDSYGVVEKINPKLNEVYLVFTAHYSHADSGRFENFDGLVPVLNTLKEKGVKGSFFPTGVCFDVEKYQEPIKRLIGEGHYLSSHSYAHLLLCDENDRNISLVSEDSLRADFAIMESKLESYGLTKEQYCWLIPPYEVYDQKAVDVMKDMGYRLINPTSGFLTGMDWTSPGADNYHSTEMILENLWKYEQENTFNGVVLLIHAMNYPDRTDADRPYNHLGSIIDKLKEKGYTFKTMFDVIEAEKAASK
ncbi:MAG: polysaccharide deacetylase family protein [Bacteroidales bacterium]|jgi:peptidoglycan/xylan/chitin deacetylase (PgdA/CDA1 family)|nr:polysaccharide deacetylase family protein [Bacteroidales bacterium]